MNTVTKTMINKVYRDGRLSHASYHSDRWTTNTHIAEVGTIYPRVYKDTLDLRPKQNSSNIPALESLLDRIVGSQPVTSFILNETGGTTVNTEDFSYNYDALYFDYMMIKYGLQNLQLESLGYTSKLIASDDDGRYVAVLMGLKK